MNAISSRQPAADGFCGTSEPGVYLLLGVQLPRINLSFCFSLGGLSRASLTVLLNPLFFCCYMEGRQVPAMNVWCAEQPLREELGTK